MSRGDRDVAFLQLKTYFPLPFPLGENEPYKKAAAADFIPFITDDSKALFRVNIRY
jgi:hypothetical protein